MNAIEHALNRVPQIDGMIGAVLVEATTGHVVGALHVGNPDGSPDGRAGDGDHRDTADSTDSASAVLAAAATDLVHIVALLAAQQAGAGPFDELIVALRERHHIIRPLPAPEDGLFLLVTLDRRRANLALARHQMQALESQIVA